MLAGTTSAAIGCSLLVDTSDLAGPDPIADAAPDRMVTIDAPSDATTDTATDAGVVTCDATFCDDFDEGGLGALWSSQQIQNGATFTLDTTDPTSKPNALRAQLVDTGNTTESRRAFLHQTLSAGKKIACELDVKVLGGPTSRHVDLLRFRTSGAGVTEYSIWFGLRGGAANPGAIFREDVEFPDGGCDCPRGDLTPPMPVLGRWTHVKMETDLARGSLSYDGVVVAEAAFGGFAPTTAFIVSLGASGYPTSTADVLLDSFFCTITP
jgi:hypothetical protein